MKRIAYQTLVRTLYTATQVQRSRKAAEAQGQGLVILAKNQAQELMQLGYIQPFFAWGSWENCEVSLTDIWGSLEWQCLGPDSCFGRSFDWIAPSSFIYWFQSSQRSIALSSIM